MSSLGHRAAAPRGPTRPPNPTEKLQLQPLACKMPLETRVNPTHASPSFVSASIGPNMLPTSLYRSCLCAMTCTAARLLAIERTPRHGHLQRSSHRSHAAFTCWRLQQECCSRNKSAAAVHPKKAACACAAPHNTQVLRATAT
jgi:hypothetical protein